MDTGVRRASGLPGLLGRIIAVLATGALFGWLWWRLRRVLRQAQQDASGIGSADAPLRGSVIEGEVIRDEWKDRQDPHGPA